MAIDLSLGYSSCYLDRLGNRLKALREIVGVTFAARIARRFGRVPN